MKHSSNIGAIVAIVIVFVSYALFALMTNKESVLYVDIPIVVFGIIDALSRHIAWIIIALIFFNESKNNIVRFISLYTIIFFTLVVAIFIVIGLWKDESYFRYKLCLYLSVCLTCLYETFTFIRKYAHTNRFNISSYMHNVKLYSRLFLQKDKKYRK